MTRQGTVRRLGHDARVELAAHLLRLTPCQRRMRFNGAVNDEFVHTYCRGFCGTRLLVLAANRRMENIALRFGTGLASDGTQIDAAIDVAPPDDLSLFEEPLFNGSHRRRRENRQWTRCRPL